MTRRDEVIRMAREAGFDADDSGAFVWAEQSNVTKELERFAALVAAAERERCLSCYSPDDTATDWADKIRALNDEVGE